MFGREEITTIYISQAYGYDYWAGISKENTDGDGPLQTIEYALEKVAEMRKFNYMQPVRLVILDDVYRVSKPILIDENIGNITITSENKSIISGGIEIKGFKEDVFNGHRCFSAPVDGIDDGFWFTDLYVDGKRADFTCYPKDRLLTAEDVEERSSKLMASSKWFIAHKEDTEILKTFRNFGDCFISYNHYWVDEHTPIESYDLDERKIVFKYKSRYTIEPTHPRSKLEYKIENVAEMFENPNEWYLDRSEKKVYYIPRNVAQAPDNIKVYAPVAKKLFVVCGNKENKVKNIYFKNLTLAYTKGDYRSVDGKKNSPLDDFDTEGEGFASDIQSLCDAHGSVEFYYAHGCSVEGCELRNLGVHAITINNGCNRITVADNDMYDLGAGGVKMGGDCGEDVREHTYGNIIRNNYIKEAGSRYFAACGVLAMHSYENIIANNEISDQYYTGISMGWVWGYKENISRDNIIEKNYIHHIGQGELSDMGGIYTLGIQPGTIIRNNIIHDVTSKHYGGWGIYTDEGSGEMLIENNICYNLKCNAFHQHYGCMNTVRNNIFAKAKEEVAALSRPEWHVGAIFENNILVADSMPIYRAGWEDHSCGFMGLVRSSNNLLYNVGGDVSIINIRDKYYTLEEAREKFGLESGSIIADPLFRDYENNDYELCDDSPAYKMGFKKIDTSDVGVKR